MTKKTLAILISIWLGWFLVLYGFQALVTMRLGIETPDLAVPWTATETLPNSNDGKIYLLEPMFNRQVAWDSEYYLGIAVGGYDDPAAGRVRNPETGQMVVKNYSFFPLYPWVMRVVAFPLQVLGLTPIATASLAGIVVALLGTMAGMAAIYDLVRTTFSEETAARTVFYLLIFPTSFFFAQVYTEGLYIGLAFWSLALSKRKQWGWSSVLAILATWTRAHGVILALPLGLAWLSQVRWREPLRKQLTWKWGLQGLSVVLPIAAYLAWRFSSLGQGWAELQEFYFGRGLFALKSSLGSWYNLYQYARTVSEGGVYFGVEVLACGLALVGSLWLMRRDPQVAWFSLAAALLSIFSGSAQSMARYMLIVPAMFFFLGAMGNSKAFDRFWTLVSLLLMGMSVMLFSFDLWVG